jgi:hypothetical protein
MNFISRITVKCIKQDDLTGSDDLHFFVNGNFIGKVSMSTGETKEIDGENIPAGGAAIAVGDEIKVEEFDIVDPNDLLFKHVITQVDIRQGSFSEVVNNNAHYEFTIFFS